jgi:hypothetical protein
MYQPQAEAKKREEEEMEYLDSSPTLASALTAAPAVTTNPTLLPPSKAEYPLAESEGHARLQEETTGGDMKYSKIQPHNFVERVQFFILHFAEWAGWLNSVKNENVRIYLALRREGKLRF